MTKAPSSIADLVATFHRNRDTYTAAPYNETQVRREFIDPFFAALGWDVDNTAGKTAAQRQITPTDNQIDQLGYKLYNLTDEETRIVEEAAQEPRK